VAAIEHFRHRDAGQEHGKEDGAETFLADMVRRSSHSFDGQRAEALSGDSRWPRISRHDVLQCFTTCQPEHGVADDMALHQAQRVRDSRGAPEFVFDLRKGETYQELWTSRAIRHSISTGTRRS